MGQSFGAFDSVGEPECHDLGELVHAFNAHGGFTSEESPELFLGHPEFAGDEFVVESETGHLLKGLAGDFVLDQCGVG